MAAETWSVKIDDELKSKIQDLMKNGFENGNDFVRYLVNLYELDCMKGSNGLFSAEVGELELLTDRIVGIFLNAGRKINTISQDKDLTLEKVTTENELKVKELNEKIGELQNYILCLKLEKNELEESNKKLKQDVLDKEKVVNSVEQLNIEYKNKSNEINGKLNSFNDLQDKYNSVVGELRDLKIKFTDIQNENLELKSEIGIINRNHQVELKENLVKVRSEFELEYEKRIKDREERYIELSGLYNKLQEEILSRSKK